MCDEPGVCIYRLLMYSVSQLLSKYYFGGGGGGNAERAGERVRISIAAINHGMLQKRHNVSK